MPFSIFNWEIHKINYLIGDELASNLGLKAELYIEKVGKLNLNQEIYYIKILEAIKVKKEIAHFFYLALQVLEKPSYIIYYITFFAHREKLFYILYYLV